MLIRMKDLIQIFNLIDSMLLSSLMVLEHLQQLLILTCYSYNFAKNSKTPLQQLPIFTSYFSQLAKFLPRARIVPRAAFTSYRRFRRLPRPPGPSRARAYSSRADPERSISPSRAFKDLPARLLLCSAGVRFCSAGVLFRPVLPARVFHQGLPAISSAKFCRPSIRYALS